MRWQKISRG